MARKQPNPGGEQPKRRQRPARQPARSEPAEPDADGYIALAEHAPNRREALKLYEKAVAAGEKAIGAEAFQAAAGQFWSILETRPYMRARFGLAGLLWTLGRRDEAVGHLQEMLRLNPGDNQGVRYTLLEFLLFLDRNDEAARLIEQFADDDSAAWAYTKALIAFRQQGDTIDTRRLLKAAKKTNKRVPPYLTGEKFPPAEQPGWFSPGDAREAVNYVAGFQVAWKDTAGAIVWLRANTKKKPATSPDWPGPAETVKASLEGLPQRDDVWQVDFRPLPSWVRAGPEMVRPNVILAASLSTDLILAHQITEGVPGPANLWDVLVGAMRHPAAGKPHRPSEIQVRSGDVWQPLRPHVEEVGVQFVQRDALDHMDGLLEHLSRQLGGGREPGLLDVPRITPERVASFYAAAASFFRQSPWKKVGYEAAIKVECDRFESGPWYAVLMGQSGLTNGLALYEDVATLRRMWSGDESDEENARETVATSVMFGEEWEIPVADLDAAKKFGWPVARPDAYPWVIRKERGRTTRPPLAWELELLEACLRTMPEFVNRHPQDDRTPEDFTPAVASGELKLTLTWTDADEA
jgi:hypothetical protein